jgi:lactoylglutathione lyase
VVSRFREPFPILLVDDVSRAVEFYGSVFGFELSYRWPAEGEPEFAFLRLEPLGIGVSKRKRAEEHAFLLALYADDVDEAAERLRAGGAEEVLAPADQKWGERMTSFRDLDGHLINVFAARRDLA